MKSNEIRPNLSKTEYSKIKSFSIPKDELLIVKVGKEKKRIPLESQNYSSTLKEFFENWYNENPKAALKGMFDFLDEEKIIKKILFGINLFVFGGIAAVFLIDGLNMLKCNLILEDPARSTITDAQIKGVKKNRRGNLIWDLEFMTASNHLMRGKRAAVNPEAATHSPGVKESIATVIYSPENPKCFDVSTKREISALPKAQRWFTTQFNIGFGGFFFVVWTTLTIWLGRALFFQKSSHVDLVEQVFSEKMKLSA